MSDLTKSGVSASGTFAEYDLYFILPLHASRDFSSRPANRWCWKSSHDRMHLFFDPDGRPFLLDSQMRWEVEPNAFLTRLSLVSGKTSSPRTWRSYAYQSADWLSFCERTELDWKRATELNIATCRNILASQLSPQTERPLKRSTINHKLTVICQFYRFARKKGWIDALPFELETTRLYRRSQANLAPCAKTGPGSLGRITLKLTEGREELEIPPGARCGDSSGASEPGEIS
jgi:hypothetical protein